MAELTPEQIAALRGAFVVKCVKAGGHTLSGYGGYTWAEGEEQDLLDDALPDTLRAADFWTASNMCRDSALELAQLIAAGDFEIVLERKPDPTVMMQRLGE